MRCGHPTVVGTACMRRNAHKVYKLKDDPLVPIKAIILKYALAAYSLVAFVSTCIFFHTLRMRKAMGLAGLRIYASQQNPSPFAAKAVAVRLCTKLLYLFTCIGSYA